MFQIVVKIVHRNKNVCNERFFNLMVVAEKTATINIR